MPDSRSAYQLLKVLAHQSQSHAQSLPAQTDAFTMKGGFFFLASILLFLWIS